MKTHKFDVEDAKKYGVEKAILLEHLKFHQEANHGNSNMVIDGKVHAFIKPKTIKEMYPYMNYASVRRWLKELEEDGVIESCKPKARGGYHLKYYHVKGYKIPNDQNDQSNVQSNHSLNDQNDQSSNTTNVKNNHYDNKSVSTTGTDFPNSCEFLDEARDIANYLLESIIEYDPTHKYAHNKPAIDSWVLDIERAMRLDGRTKEQLEFIIDYIYQSNGKHSDFWAGNVESGAKLRKHFDKIKSQIRSESNGRTNKRKQENIEKAVQQFS